MGWLPDGCLRWLSTRMPARRDCRPEVRRAQDLIAAIDRGGLPLNPAIVNQIGRALGLDVSSKARIEDTVERIRQALRRV